MYDHPYRLDTVFVQYLFERLHGVSSTSQNPIPADPDATPVCLVSVEELTTLINVAFWASFKKEEGRSVTIAVQGSVSKVEMMTPMALIYKALFPSISTFETPPPPLPHRGRVLRGCG